MGCEECEKNLGAELEAKDEEDLTESEKKALETGEMPEYYGPLSSWDGDYCEFCHAIGQIGGIFFGAVGFFFATAFLKLQLAVGIGIVIWLVLALVVGYVGRFPVLGALFGPMVEKALAVYGHIIWKDIYVTKKAKQEYGPAKPAAEDQNGRYNVVENTFPIMGAEMHLVASPQALEECASMDAPGALKLVEVDHGQIVDIKEFDKRFNKFRNIQDHVGHRQFNNICQADAQNEGPTTILQFSDFLQSGGQEGIE